MYVVHAPYIRSHKILNNGACTIFYFPATLTQIAPLHLAERKQYTITMIDNNETTMRLCMHNHAG